MQYTKYVGNTWLVAQVLHPFLFCAMVVLRNGITSDLPYIFFSVATLGVAFSLPLLLLVSMLLPLMISLPLPAGFRFTSLCLTLSPIMLLYCYLLEGRFCGWYFSTYMLVLPLPALASTLLAAWLRKPQFNRLCAAYDAQKAPTNNWNPWIS